MTKPWCDRREGSMTKPWCDRSEDEWEIERLRTIEALKEVNVYEFRVVLQIEQIDKNGRPLCTYGPEPVILFETDDADEAMEYIEKHTNAEGCYVLSD